MIPDRTYGPTFPDNTGQARKHTAKQKRLSQQQVTQPNHHDVEGMSYNNSHLAEYNKAKPTSQEHAGQETKTPLKEQRKYTELLRNPNNMTQRACGTLTLICRPTMRGQ